jgi:hypothetical protein
MMSVVCLLYIDKTRLSDLPKFIHVFTTNKFHFLSLKAIAAVSSLIVTKCKLKKNSSICSNLFFNFIRFNRLSKGDKEERNKYVCCGVVCLTNCMCVGHTVSVLCARMFDRDAVDGVGETVR